MLHTKSTKTWRSLLSLMLVVAMVLQFAVPTVSASTSNGVTILDGKVGITNSVTDATSEVTDGTVTISIACNGSKSYTNVVTIRNNSASKATLSFDYQLVNYRDFTDLEHDTGTIERTLAAGEAVTITYRTAMNAKLTTELILSNISLNAVDEHSDLTLGYDNNLGDVTLNGATVAPDTVIPNDVANGITLTATAKPGNSFSGWVNLDTNELITADPTHTFYLTKDLNVQAVFAAPGDAALFTVAGYGSTLYTLPQALELVGNPASETLITLAVSGTLAAGIYTIPANVNLLIPCKDGDVGNFGGITKEEGWSTGGTQYAYRTLTLATGAMLNFTGGSLNVNGRVLEKGGNGSGLCTDSYGHIELKAGSSINMKDGSHMYCYGYVTGQGAVVAEKGSQVFEIMQVTGWRGGTYTEIWLNKSENGKSSSFAFNDYAIQNIEANFIVKSGAYARLWAAIYAANTRGVVAVQYIGDVPGISGAPLFIPSLEDENASVRRVLDTETGRMKYTFNGEVLMDELKLSVNTPIGTYYIHSGNHALAIPYNTDFIVADGGKLTMKKSYKLLPGSSITIEEGGELTVNGNLYLYATADYVGKGYSTQGNYCPVGHIATPGVSIPTMNASSPNAKLIADGVLNINYGCGLFVTSSGANVVKQMVFGKGTLANNSNKTTDTFGLEEITTSGSGDSAHVAIHDIATVSVIEKVGSSYFCEHNMAVTFKWNGTFAEAAYKCNASCGATGIETCKVTGLNGHYRASVFIRGVEYTGDRIAITGKDFSSQSAPMTSVRPLDSAPVTVEAWIKTSNANAGIIWGNSTVNFAVQNGHPVFAGVEFGNANVATGAWTHVAITFDASNAYCYVNGVLVQTVGASVNTDSAKTGLMVLGNGFQGSIASLAVYADQRTAEEIWGDMIVPGFETMVAYYELETDAATYADRSGQGYTLSSCAHDFDVDFIWNSDCTAATAAYTCKNCQLSGEVECFESYSADKGMVATVNIGGVVYTDTYNDYAIPYTSTVQWKSQRAKYITVETFPATFEATIKLHQGGGVIWSTWKDDNSPYIRFEVTADGHPNVKLSANATTFVELTFDQVNVATGKTLHLAVSIDSANGKAICYINGVKIQEIENSNIATVRSQIESKIEATASAMGAPSFCSEAVSNLSKGLRNPFSGAIATFAVYTSVRTAAQIMEDTTLKSGDSLQAAIDLRESQGLIIYYDSVKSPVICSPVYGILNTQKGEQTIIMNLVGGLSETEKYDHRDDGFDLLHNCATYTYATIYTEGDGITSLKAVCKCVACIKMYGNGQEFEASIGSTTTAATCTTPGQIKYTANFNNSYIKNKVTVVEIPVDPDAHAWDKGVITSAPNCRDYGEIVYTCQHDPSHTKVEGLDPDPNAHVPSIDDGNCETDILCAYCGTVTTPGLTHTDSDDDHFCNNAGCGFKVSACVNEGNDHYCDICGAQMSEHEYTGDCDADCNICGETREAGDHTYDNACDPDCNACGATRETSHTYDNACDADCNVCGATREVAGHQYDNDCDATCNICQAEREVAGHKYDNDCDATCNICQAEREVAGHQYDNDCDATCNICQAEREVAGHKYDNDCDATCNICQAEREVAGHQYDNDCDATCNICQAEREVAGHKYDNDCDATCNICQAEREVAGHKYDNDCDATCNICQAEREVAGHHGGNATCTEQAICEECGERYGDTKGHTPGEAAMENYVESTWSSVGGYDMVVRCVDCGSVLSSEHHDALLNPFYNNSMVLANNLTISLNIKKDTLDADELASGGYYAVVTRIDASGVRHETEIPMSEWREHTKNRYQIYFNKLSAKEMSDELELVLYNSDGEQVTVVYEISVREHAMSEIEQYLELGGYDKFVTLMVDMLNYGAAAQKYLNYNTDNLANSMLTAEHQSYATGNAVPMENIDKSGFAAYQNTNMDLKNNMVLNMVFWKDAFGVDISQVVAKVTYTHHSTEEGTVLEKTINGTDFDAWTSKNGRERCKIAIDWLVIADGDQEITVTFYDLAGNELGGVSESLSAALGTFIEAQPSEELWPAMLKFMRSAYIALH